MLEGIELGDTSRAWKTRHLEAGGDYFACRSDYRKIIELRPCVHPRNCPLQGYQSSKLELIVRNREG